MTQEKETSKSIAQRLREINESLDLLIRLKISALKGDRTQKDLILFLDALSVPGARIADLLGTSTQTVYPTISRNRKKQK